MIPHATASQWIKNIGANPQSVLLDGSAATQVAVDTSPVIDDAIKRITKAIGKESGWNTQPKAEISLIARVRQTATPYAVPFVPGG